MRGMLVIVLTALLATGFVAFSAGAASTNSVATQKNLMDAMHGEAFAYIKYLAYADAARKNGDPELAGIFERAATMERYSHFVGSAGFAHLVGSDVANLNDAIAGENYEYTTMYPAMAKQARSEGNTAVANWLTSVSKDEGRHRDQFKAALLKRRK